MKLKDFLTLKSHNLIISKDGLTLYSIESLHRDTEDKLYGNTLVTLYVENSLNGNKSRKLITRKNCKDYQIYTDLIPKEQDQE